MSTKETLRTVDDKETKRMERTTLRERQNASALKVRLSLRAKETKQMLNNKKRGKTKENQKVARASVLAVHTNRLIVHGLVAHIQPELFSCSLTRKEIVLSFYQVFPLFRWFMHFFEVRTLHFGGVPRLRQN